MNGTAPTKRREVIAHRGASGYRPENTLPAVELAHRQGADWIECDVVLTRDDELLVQHDVELDLVTDVAAKYPGRSRPDGRFYALDFTMEEIRGLRSRARLNYDLHGELHAGRFPATPAPQSLTTLGEWLERIQNLNRASGREAGVCVELKGPVYHAKAGRELARRAGECLDRQGYNRTTARCRVMSFEPPVLRWMRQEMDWQSPMLQLIGPSEWGESDFDYDRLLTPPGLEEIAQYATWLGAHLPQVLMLEDNRSPRPTGLVQAAHEAGLKVAAYTFQREGLPDGHTLEGLLDYALGPLGLNAVISDFPDVAVAARNRRAGA